MREAKKSSLDLMSIERRAHVASEEEIYGYITMIHGSSINSSSSIINECIEWLSREKKKTCQIYNMCWCFCRFHFFLFHRKFYDQKILKPPRVSL
jgi:hypothetical protein